jgi:catechol 2,3-dioxygenase-like lactoylglutathione lyase family enzyme
MPGSDTPKATAFECVIPILRVLRLSASVDYYVGVLGFKVDWHQAGAMASVSRDGHALMLCEGGQGNPGTWVWIGVDDAAALFDEYTAKGATIRRTPTNYPWAYEMHVEDPDGHILRFGSEPRSDRPFAAWSPHSTANTVVD